MKVENSTSHVQLIRQKYKGLHFNYVDVGGKRKKIFNF